LKLARFDVEDEYQNGDGREDVGALDVEIVFDKTILSSVELEITNV
jgi:hypothetical protein